VFPEYGELIKTKGLIENYETTYRITRGGGTFYRLLIHASGQ
jgi:hypothetical protein